MGMHWPIKSKTRVTFNANSIKALIKNYNDIRCASKQGQGNLTKFIGDKKQYLTRIRQPYGIGQSFSRDYSVYTLGGVKAYGQIESSELVDGYISIRLEPDEPLNLNPLVDACSNTLVGHNIHARHDAPKIKEVDTWAFKHKLGLVCNRLKECLQACSAVDIDPEWMKRHAKYLPKGLRFQKNGLTATILPPNKDGSPVRVCVTSGNIDQIKLIIQQSKNRTNRMVVDLTRLPLSHEEKAILANYLGTNLNKYYPMPLLRLSEPAPKLDSLVYGEPAVKSRFQLCQAVMVKACETKQDQASEMALSPWPITVKGYKSEFSAIRCMSEKWETTGTVIVDLSHSEELYDCCREPVVAAKLEQLEMIAGIRSLQQQGLTVCIKNGETSYQAANLSETQIPCRFKAEDDAVWDNLGSYTHDRRSESSPLKVTLIVSDSELAAHRGWQSRINFNNQHFDKVVVTQTEMSAELMTRLTYLQPNKVKQLDLQHTSMTLLQYAKLCEHFGPTLLINPTTIKQPVSEDQVSAIKSMPGDFNLNASAFKTISLNEAILLEQLKLSMGDRLLLPHPYTVKPDSLNSADIEQLMSLPAAVHVDLQALAKIQLDDLARLHEKFGENLQLSTELIVHHTGPELSDNALSYIQHNNSEHHYQFDTLSNYAFAQLAPLSGALNCVDASGQSKDSYQALVAGLLPPTESADQASAVKGIVLAQQAYYTAETESKGEDDDQTIPLLELVILSGTLKLPALPSTKLLHSKDPDGQLNAIATAYDKAISLLLAVPELSCIDNELIETAVCAHMVSQLPGLNNHDVIKAQQALKKLSKSVMKDKQHYDNKRVARSAMPDVKTRHASKQAICKIVQRGATAYQDILAPKVAQAHASMHMRGHKAGLFSGHGHKYANLEDEHKLDASQSVGPG